MSPEGSCNASSKLIFSCSGAADVGEIADRLARTLHREGNGRMYCLAGIGADLGQFIQTSKDASEVLVIDGCSVDCARSLMEKNGFSGFKYMRITDLGLEKGQSPATDASVETAAAHARSL